jgi:hypothetical protein
MVMERAEIPDSELMAEIPDSAHLSILADSTQENFL